MCDKKLLRFRNSRCAVGLQRVNICAALRLGYACSGCRIVSIQETLVERGPEHAEHNCTLSALCAYGPGDEEPQIVDIGSKVPLVSIGEPFHWYSPSDRVMEPPAPMYVSVNRPVTAIAGIQWGNKVLNVDQLVAHTWELAWAPDTNMDGPDLPEHPDVEMTEENASELKTSRPKTTFHKPARPASRRPGTLRPATRRPDTPRPDLPWPDSLLPQTSWPHMPHLGTPWPHLTGGQTLPGQGVIRPGMAAAVVMSPAATTPKEETAPEVTTPQAKTPSTTASTRRELSDEELADLLQSELAGMEKEERLPPLSPETPSVKNSELSELPKTELSELEAMFGEDAMDVDMDGTDADDEDEEDWDNVASDLSTLDAMFGREAIDHEMNDIEEEEEGYWADSDSDMSDAPTVYLEVPNDPGMEVLPSIETPEPAEQWQEIPERFFNWPVADGLGTTFLEAALWPRTLDGVNIYEDLYVVLVWYDLAWT
ncbi:hypothetical protein NEMBOFW57_008315 [Staphylotrichum longicolle]|uniref:Uncharacterized protein n=1 Tax=Staphylotrichum longicolle TaxID=669026 RepID=A0AAD4ER37_9PEZI|nr:hypothetical protein NEMBOFW57_008315 [Staphylotrichum longicolle]